MLSKGARYGDFMERKYLKDLIAWNEDPDRKPLLVMGARQVGKTYLIKNLFAEQFYKNKYVRIDCSNEPDFVDFVYRNDNLTKVLQYIQINYDFVPDGSHLLIFDEVQECLPLIKMMKHFNEQKREIPLIVTGSLVRIKLHRQSHKRGGFANKGFLFPVGNINKLTIYPLTFDEFLYNYRKSAYDFLKKSFLDKTVLDSSIHEELMDIFYDYLFVGGMPEAVDTFIKAKDDTLLAYNKVNKKIKEIYDDYLNDMELYQASKESILKSRSIFNNIYTQLNKENKNFKPSLINKNYKSRDIFTPIEWLETANIINKSSLLKERVAYPLIAKETSSYRLYLADMGIFTFQSGLNAKNFIFNKDNSLSRIYYENYLSIELTARNYPLYYWKGKRNSEIEYLIDLDGNVVPIDCKKTRGALNSLDEFRMHNKNALAIKVSSNRYGYDEKNKILTLPFYYFSLFLNENDKEKITTKTIDEIFD